MQRITDWGGFVSKFALKTAASCEAVQCRYRGIPFYLAAGKAKLLASTSIWPPANVLDVMWAVLPLLIYVNIALFVSWFAVALSPSH